MTIESMSNLKQKSGNIKLFFSLTDMSLMEVSDLFAVGKIFGNVEEVKSAVREYNEQNYTEFIVETNNKNSLILVCKYGRIRASKSQGIRKNLQYNNLKCKACIALYKSKKNMGISKLLRSASNITIVSIR